MLWTITWGILLSYMLWVKLLMLSPKRFSFFFIFRELESIANGLTPAPFNLGNTSYLSQETTQERQALYSQLVNSYKWIDKVWHCFDFLFLTCQRLVSSLIPLVSFLIKFWSWIGRNYVFFFISFQIHEYSLLATQVLSGNGLKRSYFNNSNKRRRPLTSCHNVMPQ